MNIKVYLSSIIALLLIVIYGGYTIHQKNTEISNLKLAIVNNHLSQIDTLKPVIDSLNYKIVITLNDIKYQKIYLDSLQSKLKNAKQTEISIDSALKLLNNL